MMFGNKKQSVMNFKTLLVTAVAAILSMTSCAQQKKENAMTENKGNNKVLVAYFSATGTTKRAATELADVMGGTLYEITPETPYTTADLDWTDKNSRSTIEMKDKTSRPAIKGKVEDIDNYDTVFLGYPVWWYVAPTIINTFVESNDLKGKTVICFATSGGSPVKPCVDSLRVQYPDINWAEGKLLNRVSKSDLLDWKKSLGL